MKLFFIRHGQSENNLLWEKTGANRGRSEDPDLTGAGHQQAQLLAKYISEKDQSDHQNGNQEFHRDTFQFTHLYTSLMIRSVKTGSYLAERLGIPLRAWPEIHECGGIFLDDEETGAQNGLPGRARSYFELTFPALHLPETITEAGWWNRPFEAHEDRPVRAREVLKRLLELHGDTDDHVAIISHGGFYMEFVRALFQIGDPKAWYLMHNTAVSRFDFWGENGVTMVYHNRTDHLPIDLIT